MEASANGFSSLAVKPLISKKMALTLLSSPWTSSVHWPVTVCMMVSTSSVALWEAFKAKWFCELSPKIVRCNLRGLDARIRATIANTVYNNYCNLTKQTELKRGRSLKIYSVEHEVLFLGSSAIQLTLTYIKKLKTTEITLAAIIGEYSPYAICVRSVKRGRRVEHREIKWQAACSFIYLKTEALQKSLNNCYVK